MSRFSVSQFLNVHQMASAMHVEIDKLDADIAARDAEIAKLREYYEAREEVNRVGILDATTEMWERVANSRAAFRVQP